MELAEISGSDTFVHVETPVGEVVAQLTGVHYFALGAAITLYLNPTQVYVFDSAGVLLVAPEQKGTALMARIDLDLAHAYKPNPREDSDYALLPLTMSFKDGGAYALLGPSGCGKTTMLNIISGLLAPSQGSVKFDGQDVTHASPQERNIAQVFQFPVIYDTMTVAENLAFPLRNRKVPQQQIAKRVGEIAEMLELSGQLNHRAAGLAADAKQKISLGRGLVRPDVSAVLFDEPLTVIDPHLKWQLRRKLKQIHHELKLTLIYVTHDQVEALTFAEQVVVMTRGRAVQMGSADALFERPQHTFVGHFIGSPGMNFLPAQASPGELRIAGTTLSVRCDAATAGWRHQAGPAPRIREGRGTRYAGRPPGPGHAAAGHRHLPDAHRHHRGPAGQGAARTRDAKAAARRHRLAAVARRAHLLLQE